MNGRLRRRAGTAVVVLAVLTPSHLAVAPAADATVSSAAEIATWVTPIGGSSNCANVGATSVRCAHVYSSYDLVSGLETCSEFGTRAVGITTCHVTLSGTTSGPGRVVGETATLCSTAAVETLTFQFGGLSGAYPAFTVSGAVEDGDGTFAGTSDPVLIPGVGLVVQSASGKFTFGCGPPSPKRGSFTGSWTLTIA